MPNPASGGGVATPLLASHLACDAAALPPCPPSFVEAERRLLRRTGRLAELSARKRDILGKLLELGIQWRDAGGWFLLKFQTIANALGVSYNTVNNHIQSLKEDGWIERARDLTGARRYGMPVGSTRLTEFALVELGLARHAQLSGHAYENFLEKSPSERNTPAAPAVDNPQPSEPEPGAQPAELQTAPRQPSVLAADGSCIPSDLAPFLAGMTGRQLCSTMRLASPLGVRLQRIAACALSAILDADKPVAYLRTLVRSGRDWTKQPQHTGREAPPQGSIKSANTLASEREQRDRERRAQEDRKYQNGPTTEYLEWLRKRRREADSVGSDAERTYDVRI